MIPNPFTILFLVLRVLKFLPEIFGTIWDGLKFGWLLLRLRWLYFSFPGYDNLFTNEGRQWILKGFDLAGECALLTETTLDNEIIARGRHIIATDSGWASIKEIIKLALEGPDIVISQPLRSSHNTRSVFVKDGLADLFIEEADKLYHTTTVLKDGEKIAEDPVTVIWIVWFCIQIAQQIMEKREKTRIGKEQMRRYYQGVERQFTRRAINLQGVQR